MEGEIAKATEMVEQASALAAEAQDPNAQITLTIQRLCFLCDWQPTDRLLAEVPGIKKVAASINHAEALLLPGLACYLVRAERLDAEDSFLDSHLIEITIASGDPSGLPAIGEYAVARNDRKLAERLYSLLLPRAGLCAHWGMTGLVWDGPVARVLALLAAFLGDFRAAERHFQDALARSEALGAQPMLARLHYEYGRFFLGQGRIEEGRQHLREARVLSRRLSLAGLMELLDKLPLPAQEEKAEPPPPTPGAKEASLVLSRAGELWRVDFAGQHCLLKDSKGMQLLAALVEKPGVEIHVLDLHQPAQEKDKPQDTGDAGEVLDARAKEEYRRRVEALREEIEEAEAIGNSAAAERARAELEFIVRELSRAYGLGGRARRSASAVERARINAQRRLKDAIQRIASQLPQAGRHLERSIKTGVFCSYCPD